LAGIKTSPLVDKISSASGLFFGRHMAQVKADFLDQTVTFWQPRTSRTLTREDGRQIAENVSGFFRILLEWEAVERSANAPSAEKEFIVSPQAGERPA
jgi:hypothetical protein